MFKTLARIFLPNPLDRICRKTAKKGGTKIAIGWNRGLGDIALGLYALVQRIYEIIPNAEITFVTRKDLAEGFTMLAGVRTIIASDWKRGQKTSVHLTLQTLGIDSNDFDLIIDKPSPTDWVAWQRGSLIPRLQWDCAHDSCWKAFDLPDGYTYIGVQPSSETQYGFWRNWPIERWTQLFDRIERLKHVKVILFGYESTPRFHHANVIDLRGQTTLFEILSIMKNRCTTLILPDSGLLSMIYYLDVAFPIEILSLWADPDHGILKQAVFSPNPQLKHFPVIGAHRDLSSVSAQEVLNRIWPPKPLTHCLKNSEIAMASLPKYGIILLAGGDGSRLGARGPKGIFAIHGKSLFQWICEKAPPLVPIAVMTSPLNHEETVAFFENHQKFGRNVHFFQQDLLPLLDKNKKPTSLSGPDGNGSVFKSFVGSGLCRLFEEQHIDLLSIVPVENILADPADLVFLSHLTNTQSDVVIKCIERDPSDRSMGALIQREGRIEVVEYTETDPSEHYLYSYAGMMAATLAFIKKMAHIELPLHWVWKKSKNTYAWKRERFIFDALPYADRVEAACYLREQIYAPLKSIENLEKIKKLLTLRVVS